MTCLLTPLILDLAINYLSFTDKCMESRRQYKTISIPPELYLQIEKLIEDTGFRSVTEFILFYIRQTVGKIKARKQKADAILDKLPEKEARIIKSKLKELGYFE